jgi:GTP 3',8-cyclase
VLVLLPAGGLDWLPGPALLTGGEVSRLISVAVQRLGVTEIRITGGEPRCAAAALDPQPEISLTTNGIGLIRLAGPLAAAGLDRLNVSLDTLPRPAFKELARLPAAVERLSSAGLGDLDGDVGGFDGGDREHPWLQAEFVGGFAAEQ